MNTSGKVAIVCLGALAMVASKVVRAPAESQVLETLGPDTSKASLNETLAWLRDNVPQMASFGLDYAPPHISGTTVTYRPDRVFTNVRFTWLEVASCTISYERTLYNGQHIVGNQDIVKNSKHGEVERDVTIVPLGGLDPASFTIQRQSKGGLFDDLRTSGYGTPALGICVDGLRYPYYAGPNTHNTKFGVMNNLYTPTTDCKDEHGTRSLPIGDRESAMRVARALKHAAILCGAKVAPF